MNKFFAASLCFRAGLLCTLCYAVYFAVSARRTIPADWLVFLYALTITLFFVDPLSNRRGAISAAGIYTVFIFGLIAAKRGWSHLLVGAQAEHLLVGFGVGLGIIALCATRKQEYIPPDAKLPEGINDNAPAQHFGNAVPLPVKENNAVQKNSGDEKKAPLLRPLEPSLQKNQTQTRKKLFFVLTCVLAALAALYIGAFCFLLIPSALTLSLLHICTAFLAVCVIPSQQIKEHPAATALAIGFFSFLWFLANTIGYGTDIPIEATFINLVGAVVLGFWLKLNLAGENQTFEEVSNNWEYSAANQPLPPVAILIILGAAAILLCLILTVLLNP